jgi:hypothetical protein
MENRPEGGPVPRMIVRNANAPPAFTEGAW